MDDNENIKLIEQALEDYKEGALLEAKEALATVVKRIDDFEIAEELMN